MDESTGRARDEAQPGTTALYEHMPVYRARLSAVRELLSAPGDLDLDAFHMHYAGAAPLERARAFFDPSGVLLDLGCGYGSNVVWFAERAPGYRHLLGVDLIPEHVDIAERLAARRLGRCHRARFLAMDIAALAPEDLARHAGAERANSVLALNTFLHLDTAQRTRTWCFIDRVLAGGGKAYVEDFFARRPLTAEEHDTMVRESGCACLPPRAEYTDLIARALPGARIEVEDISAGYTAFAKGRHLGYRGDDPDKRRFYRTVTEMLEGGAVGGLRLEIVR